MANTYNGNTLILDSVDVISQAPLWIQKIVLIPNAGGDAATFKTWGPNGTPELHVGGASCTVTSTNQIESTGNFATASVDPGDIIEIYKSSTGNNDGPRNSWIKDGVYLINANADNNTITVQGTPLTNEANKTYSYRIWTPTEAIYILTPGTEVMAEVMDFSPAIRVNNLVLSALSSSAKVYVYLAGIV